MVINLITFTNYGHILLATKNILLRTLDFAGAYIRNKVTKVVSTSMPKPLIVATSNSPGFIIP